VGRVTIRASGKTFQPGAVNQTDRLSAAFRSRNCAPRRARRGTGRTPEFATQSRAAQDRLAGSHSTRPCGFPGASKSGRHVLRAPEASKFARHTRPGETRHAALQLYPPIAVGVNVLPRQLDPCCRLRPRKPASTADGSPPDWRPVSSRVTPACRSG